MDLLALAQQSGEVLDLVGVSVILAGAIYSSLLVIFGLFDPKNTEDLYKSFRKNLGRSILLGLEFLVAGDIIRSVTGTPSFTSIGVLAFVVLIRSFLSITFDMEIEGRWPWQKNKKTTE